MSPYVCEIRTGLYPHPLDLPMTIRFRRRVIRTIACMGSVDALLRTPL
jgi:hypothetical protein